MKGPDDVQVHWWNGKIKQRNSSLSWRLCWGILCASCPFMGRRWSWEGAMTRFTFFFSPRRSQKNKTDNQKPFWFHDVERRKGHAEVFGHTADCRASNKTKVQEKGKVSRSSRERNSRHFLPSSLLLFPAFEYPTIVCSLTPTFDRATLVSKVRDPHSVSLLLLRRFRGVGLHR